MIAGSAFAETMPLSQVKAGMKGYGLTVFEGSKVEKFDVEIIGVLNQIGPGQDLILAHVDGPVIRRAGVIAGMSGSPIYIDGKVIGALAYSWQFSKEPVAGITPIDEMLRIAQAGAATGGSVVPANATPRMTGAEFLRPSPHPKPEVGVRANSPATCRPTTSSLGAAKRIALPVSLSSFAPETIARFGHYLDDMGFVAVPERLDRPRNRYSSGGETLRSRRSDRRRAAERRLQRRRDRHRHAHRRRSRLRLRTSVPRHGRDQLPDGEAPRSSA